MGFAEAIVFMVVGWVTIYHQRSLLPKPSDRAQSAPKDHPSQDQYFTLWMIAVILPIFGLIWVSTQQLALPLTIMTIALVIAFLLCVWIVQGLNQENSQDFTDAEPILSPSQEKQLKECFLSGLYQLKAIEYHHQSSRQSSRQYIYCRGHLRSRNYKYVYDTISQNIHDAFGDRFLCQLQAKPLEHIGTDFGDRDIFLSDDPALDQALRYSFYLIPNSHPSITKSSINPLINIFSIILTSLALLMVGANQTITQLKVDKLQEGLPYALGIVTIIMARAIARYAIAKYHHLPLPRNLGFAAVLPCLGGFGYLGEITPDLAQIPTPSAIKHHNQRRILFDLVAIPNLVCLSLSIAMLLFGNWLSPLTTVTIEANSSLITPLNALNINNSIFAALWYSILQAFSPDSELLGLLGDITTTRSPLSLAGLVAMSMGALQLLPLRGLDGEYLAIAMGNHHQIATIARLTRLVILAIALFAQPWLRIYGLLLFVLPTPRPLINNEGIELDQKRDLLGFFLIAIALLILLPIPKFLINIS